MLCKFIFNNKEKEKKQSCGFLHTVLTSWSKIKLKIYQKCELICGQLLASLFFIKMKTWK